MYRIGFIKSLIFLVCLAPMFLFGQRPTGGSTQVPDEPDTLQASYFLLSDPSISRNYDDTVLVGFHRYERIRDDENYFSLGFPGSPVRRVLFDPVTDPALFMGFNQFDPYRYSENTFKYFHLKKAFTYASYCQGRSQDDGIFKTLFSRNFKDGINFTLDYSRTNNQGFYNHQTVRNTLLGMGLWYKSSDNSLNVFLNYFSNVFSHENNGGVVSDTLFNQTFLNQRIAIPVWLTNAFTRDQQKIYQIKANYLPGKDSVDSKGIGFNYLFKWDRRFFKYFDLSPPSDSSYYESLMTDDRGIRHFFEHNVIHNRFSLSFQPKDDQKWVEAGIFHNYHQINQEPDVNNRQEWFLFGKFKWNLATRIQLESKADIGIAGSQASFLVQGRLNLNLHPAGELTGKLTISRRRPSMLEEKAFISQELVWDNSFDNLFINRLQVQYRFPWLNLIAEGGQLLITNYIYFNEMAFPEQFKNTITLTSLRLGQTSAWRKWQFEHQVLFQISNNADVVRVPKWHSSHEVSFTGPVFKSALLINTGLSLNMNADFQGVTYAPIIGQFVLTNDNEIKWYPDLDIFLGIKVKYFRAFLKMENIFQLTRSDIHFQTIRYPQQDFNYRIGIGWYFFN